MTDTLPASKVCVVCKIDLPIEAFGKDVHAPFGKQRRCKACHRAYTYAWRSRNPDKVRAYNAKHYQNSQVAQNYNLRSKFKMTLIDYHLMLAEQGGGCAACGTTVPGGTGKFHVDHDHACCPGQRSCGKCIRGLLCNNCNRGLGLFKDSPERLQLALDYLRRTTKQ